MISYRVITDDYGDSVFVTTIEYPNRAYCSIIVQRWHRQFKLAPKIRT